MKYEKLSKYVKLTQGQVVNKDTAYLFSDTKDENFIYPLYRIADLQTGDKEHCSRYVSRDVAETVIVQPNNILFSRVTCECFRGFSGVFHNNLFKVELLNEIEIIEDYLFVVLKSDFVKKQAERLTSSSVVPDLTHSLFKSIIIPVPSKAIQKEIVKTYNSIMGKFLTNTKTISELEAMAKTLYDYWFLQFDFPDENGKPYKSSGGKMVWNEELKREIPEGWSVKRLNDLVTIIDNRGKNPPYMDCKTEYPIIDVATLRKEYRCIDYSTCSHYVNKDIYDNWFRAGHPKKGDILFSTVGSLAEIKLFYPNKCFFGAIAQNIVALRSTSELYSYLYQVLLIEKQRIIGYRIGSVQPSLKVGHVLEHKILVPNIVILGKYSNTIENINLEINQRIMENQELASLRDFLLPMLMNGQVTFKDLK